MKLAPPDVVWERYRTPGGPARCSTAQTSPKAGHHQDLRIGRARTQPEGQTLRGETNRLALTEKHADTDFVNELFAERLSGPKVVAVARTHGERTP